MDKKGMFLWCYNNNYINQIEYKTIYSYMDKVHY